MSLAPQSEIIPGLLWMGGRPWSYHDYDLAVSCEHRPALTRDWWGALFHVPMIDMDDFEIPELAVGMAVEAALTFMDAGKKVLVHCSAGLNRSGLVVARIVQRWENLSAKDALTFIRAKRHPLVLCNHSFERWVLGEAA